MQARFALIIGVSDYRVFDHSAGQPRGTSDLFGPPQNIVAALDFCNSLGFSAADIGLLSSPLVPPRGGHPALYAAATRDAVLEGVRLLARRLAESEASQGLIWFSGHGDALEGAGPVLCVEDTALVDGQLRQVVSLFEIGEILTAHAPQRAVTVILDSCSSGTPPAGSTRVLGGLRAAARLRDHDTLISATRAGQVGMEVQVDGVWRGALSWALCAAATPYARTWSHGFAVPDLSVGDWVQRARLLLDGLSVNQRPQLRGAGGAVVLQPTGIPPIVPTGRIADQRRGNVEIYGDESGQITGDEAVWMSYNLADPITGAPIGSLVETFNTTTVPAYRDAWSWSGTPWPASFKMTYNALGTQGVNTAPPVPNNAPPMQAFLSGLSQGNFGGQATSGDTVWGIVENSVPNVFLGYLLRNPTTGALRWFITWTGYVQRGTLLPDLPSPNGGGGVQLDTDGDVLWFTQLSAPPSTLTGVSVAYVVSA